MLFITAVYGAGSSIAWATSSMLASYSRTWTAEAPQRSQRFTFVAEIFHRWSAQHRRAHASQSAVVSRGGCSFTASTVGEKNERIASNIVWGHGAPGVGLARLPITAASIAFGAVRA
jgi:hypothetical protein